MTYMDDFSFHNDINQERPQKQKKVILLRVREK